jgi:hypothetical protein
MYNHVSKFFSYLTTTATFLGAFLITASLPHAAEPKPIFASVNGVPVCMRPVAGDTTGDVSIEGVFWKCEKDDGVLWRNHAVGGMNSHAWFINDNSCTDKNDVSTCKCLTREGTSVLLRKCNFMTGMTVGDHSQLWRTDIKVPNGFGGVTLTDGSKILVLANEKSNRGGYDTMCLTTGTSQFLITSGFLWVVGNMFMDLCPGSPTPLSQQFLFP